MVIGVYSNQNDHTHIHLYGRAKSAIWQPYGQACTFPHIKENPDFYSRNESLNKSDIVEIQKQISILKQTKRYNLIEWGL